MCQPVAISTNNTKAVTTEIVTAFYHCHGEENPYKSDVMSIVGEGLAPPETLRKISPKCEADQFFRRVRRLRRTEPFRSIPFACGADLCFRRDVPQPETAPLCRYATPPLRGDHIGHPQNDGRIRYRKREIENTRFSHCDQRPAAGAASRSPTNPLMRLSVGEGLAPPETSVKMTL